MIFNLAEAAETSWRRLDGHNQLSEVILGVNRRRTAGAGTHPKRPCSYPANLSAVFSVTMSMRPSGAVTISKLMTPGSMISTRCASVCATCAMRSVLGRAKSAVKCAANASRGGSISQHSRTSLAQTGVRRCAEMRERRDRSCSCASVHFSGFESENAFVPLRLYAGSRSAPMPAANEVPDANEAT
jgi:hypothetical protein